MGLKEMAVGRHSLRGTAAEFFAAVRATREALLLSEDTWRCAWCGQPVTSLPCTNPNCPGTKGRK